MELNLGPDRVGYEILNFREISQNFNEIVLQFVEMSYHTSINFNRSIKFCF
jgi:hypothetical protein